MTSFESDFASYETILNNNSSIKSININLDN